MNTVTELGETQYRRLQKIYWIARIVACPFVIVSICYAILWYFGYFEPKPTAVVDCGNWRMPSCIEKKRTDPCSPTTHLDQNLAECLKAQSMYHLLVRNNSHYTIIGARVRIPDADYVEIVRNGGEPNEPPAYGELVNKSWKLGDMDHGDELEVNAWTKNKPDRQNAGKIWINHKGPSVTPHIKTPPNHLGKWTNRYTIWVVAVAIVIIGGPFVIYKYKLCRRFCGLVPPKQAQP